MKSLSFLVVIALLACGVEARNDRKAGGATCGPDVWLGSASAPSMESFVGSIRTLRSGDSVVAVGFLDIAVDSVAVLAWYRVIDLQLPRDSIDYAFISIRFRAVRLFFNGGHEDSGYSEQERERLSRPYYALAYAVRRGKDPFYNPDVEMHRSFDGHAMVYEGGPGITDALSLLQRWRSPHIRPRDSVTNPISFIQPKTGDGLLISLRPNATDPNDLHPAMVLDGGVCENEWARLFGEVPAYGSAPRENPR